jgi:hypothetical protein
MTDTPKYVAVSRTVWGPHFMKRRVPHRYRVVHASVGKLVLESAHAEGEAERLEVVGTRKVAKVLGQEWSSRHDEEHDLRAAEVRFANMMANVSILLDRTIMLDVSEESLAELAEIQGFLSEAARVGKEIMKMREAMDR